MRSWAFVLSRRWLIFAVVVTLLTYLAWWLGDWQFQRLHDKRISNAIIRANEALAPVPVEQVLRSDGVVDRTDEWRRVTARGVYDTSRTIVWRYRTNDRSLPGVDQVVPLVTADGTALLVDRGWVPSPDSTSLPREAPDPPSGPVTVVGWVRADATGASTRVVGLGTRGLSSRTVTTAIGRPLFGGFVELESENAIAPRDLTAADLPDLSEGPHLFYGMQWWFFGVLAVTGFFYLLYDEWRTGVRPQRSGKEHPALDAVAPVHHGGASSASRRRLATRLARTEQRQARSARRRAIKAAYRKLYEAERPRG